MLINKKRKIHIKKIPKKLQFSSRDIKIKLSLGHVGFLHILSNIFHDNKIIYVSKSINYLWCLLLLTILLIFHWNGPSNFHVFKILRFWNLHWISAKSWRYFVQFLIYDIIFLSNLSMLRLIYITSNITWKSFLCNGFDFNFIWMNQFFLNVFLDGC